MSSHTVTCIEDIVGYDSSSSSSSFTLNNSDSFTLSDTRNDSFSYIAPSASQVMQLQEVKQVGLGLIKKGNQVRTIGATKMNEQSSRSHSIFVVEVRCASQIKSDESAGEDTKVQVSKVKREIFSGSTPHIQSILSLSVLSLSFHSPSTPLYLVSCSPSVSLFFSVTHTLYLS